MKPSRTATAPSTSTARRSPSRGCPSTTPTPTRRRSRPVHITANHYFVMGDDRTVSCDSRYWGTVTRSAHHREGRDADLAAQPSRFSLTLASRRPGAVTSLDGCTSAARWPESAPASRPSRCCSGSSPPRPERHRRPPPSRGAVASRRPTCSGRRPAQHLSVVNDAGVVGSGVVSGLGGLLVRNLGPGRRLPLRDPRRAAGASPRRSGPRRPTRPATASFYAGQHLHAGLNYVTMRDGVRSPPPSGSRRARPWPMARSRRSSSTPATTWPAPPA